MSSSALERGMRQLIGRINQLEQVVERQSMRINNMFREARVVEVDAETGLATVNANGVDSDPVPWVQMAGQIVDWDPPAVGQRMILISPNGDPQKGFLIPGGYTNDVPQPYTESNMYARLLGDTKVEVTPDSYLVETPTFTIKANLIVEGNVDFSEGHVRHNGKDIGDTHRHGEVMPGNSPTGVPI